MDLCYTPFSLLGAMSPLIMDLCYTPFSLLGAMSPLIMDLCYTPFSLLGAMSPLIMDLCYSFPTFLAVSILFGFSLSAWPAVTSSMLVRKKTITCNDDI